MARFGVGPFRFGGGRRTSVTFGVGPIRATFGGRRRRRWGGSGSSGGSGGSSDYYEMTPEEILALTKSGEIQAYQKREMVFVIASSRHMNRMVALLIATFGWVNLPRETRIWALALGIIVLLTFNGLRLYALGYLRKRDKNLSSLTESERSIWDENPDSWYETFKMTEGRQKVNTVSLALLVVNLVWAFAANPKPEYPGIVAGGVLGGWLVARLIIIAGEVEVGPLKLLINVLRVAVALFVLLLPLSLIALAFETDLLLGFGSLFLMPVVSLVAVWLFWKYTKIGGTGEPTWTTAETTRWFLAMVNDDAQTMQNLERTLEARRLQAAAGTYKKKSEFANFLRGFGGRLLNGLRKLV